ncbi:MAG: hypothetical protein HYR55_00970 [Acidobacteria bacterium]|nr:hypothetical protein [Acidobacteriota bacterium]
MMHETSYQTWWVLHLRVARGERLNPEEQAAYEAGLKLQHQEEVFNRDIAALRQARTALAALEAEHTQLHVKHDTLAAEIVRLEAALGERTRQLLGVEN